VVRTRTWVPEFALQITRVASTPSTSGMRRSAMGDVDFGRRRRRVCRSLRRGQVGPEVGLRTPRCAADKSADLSAGRRRRSGSAPGDNPAHGTPAFLAADLTTRYCSSCSASSIGAILSAGFDPASVRRGVAAEARSIAAASAFLASQAVADSTPTPAYASRT
jgi:hypothetical protein